MAMRKTILSEPFRILLHLPEQENKVRNELTLLLRRTLPVAPEGKITDAYAALPPLKKPCEPVPSHHFEEYVTTKECSNKSCHDNTL